MHRVCCSSRGQWPGGARGLPVRLHTYLLSLCSATASPLPHWAWLSDAYTLQVNKECHQHPERIRWEATIERAAKSDRREGRGQKPKNRIGGETKAGRQKAEWDRGGTGRLNTTILLTQDFSQRLPKTCSAAGNKVLTVNTQEKNMQMWVYTENNNGISPVFCNSLHYVMCNKTKKQN